MARWIAVTLLLCAGVVLPLQAGPTLTAKPEEVGLSSERLMRVREAVQRHLDAKALSGAVTLVARNGRIAHLEAHGLIDVEAKRPMPKDGIFRLASMSKPITAVAVMMLLEEGKVRLNDPVSRFIPEFKGMKVAVPKGGVEPPAAPAGGRGGRAVGHRWRSTSCPRLARSRSEIC